ncbi:MAG: hypothetical protein K8H88_21445, partial [Sandaracinaceae bacterium]|nr:hypothetical protein [Sandaracinaceae bacterium]
MKQVSLLLVLAALLAGGCAREHAIGLVISRNGTPANSALTVEIYDGGDCASLAGRSPRVTAMINLTASTGVSEPLPGLPPGTYTIVVTGRDPSSCALVAQACVVADPGAGRVDVPLSAAVGPGCAGCMGGRCVGGFDAGVTWCTPGQPCPLGPGEIGECCGGVCLPAGLCGNACGANCTSQGRRCCGDACVDVATDTANCNECGVRCAPGQSCEGGRCGWRLRVGGSGFTGTDQVYTAYWFQLDSRDPDPPIERITSVGVPRDAAGEVTLELGIPSVDREDLFVCEREIDCFDEARCTCADSSPGILELRVAFGLVMAERGSAPGNPEVLAYANVLLVYAPQTIGPSELDRIAPGLGLSDTFDDTIPAGITPYELGLGDARLVAASFAQRFTMGAPCED